MGWFKLVGFKVSGIFLVSGISFFFGQILISQKFVEIIMLDRLHPQRESYRFSRKILSYDCLLVFPYYL